MDRRKVVTWYLVTFAVCAALAAAVPLSGSRWTGATAAIVGIVYMWVPALVAVAVQRAWKEPVRESLALRWPRARGWAWLLVGVALPVAVAVAVTGIGLLVPGVRFDPEMEGMFARLAGRVPPEQVEAARQQIAAMPVHPWFLGIGQALVAGATINAVVSLGEELGWRGLLHRELRPLGPVRASLLTGVMWGLWHAPLVLQGHNYPAHPVAGALMMVLFCTSVSLPMFLVRERGGSVLGAAVFHGAINASAGLPVLVAIGSDLVIGVTGAVGIATWTAVSLAAWWGSRR